MSRSPRLCGMTRPLFDRPLATPAPANRRARVAWVTAGLALGGVAIAGGAQALSSASSTGTPATSTVVHSSPRPTSAPTGAPSVPNHAAGTTPTKGTDDDRSGPIANRDHRGRLCVHLDAKALAAIAAAPRTADGGVDLPLPIAHLSRCTGGAPTPPHVTLSPRPPRSPWPTVVPLPSVLPRPSHTWSPLPPQPRPLPVRSPLPIPAHTLTAPGPATTR